MLNNSAANAAEAAQRSIFDCIEQKKNFRLEAGAGAGKTYSLIQALKKIIYEDGKLLIRSKQKVACITYTEVAKNEIKKEIEEHPAILVETIHSFSWSFMNRFQTALRELITKYPKYQEEIEKIGGIKKQNIKYNRGYFSIDENSISLHHDDIPILMAQLLERKKFQKLFTQQFPVLFIDEYQDTNKHFMDALNTQFMASDSGPLIGLFGDHWQTIYSNEYNLKNYSLTAIDKGSNFRSTAAIVDVLNNLRPELKQAKNPKKSCGEARFFHTNSYTGMRVDINPNKGDLPTNIAKSLRDCLLEKLQSEGWDLNKTKILMLTHNLIASEQGYSNLKSIFGPYTDSFTKKEDPTIKYLAEIIEPLCKAYYASKYGEMFTLLPKRPTIISHADKIKWRKDINELISLRENGTIGSVINHIKQSDCLYLPQEILNLENNLNSLSKEENIEIPTRLNKYLQLKKINYSELINLVSFIQGDTSLATQHSVKGAEFDNVLVVLGGGWNNYNWPKFFELLETRKLNKQNTQGFYRARNLFYVSISRPMTRLAVIATQQLSTPSITAINSLFGKENVIDLDIPTF